LKGREHIFAKNFFKMIEKKIVTFRLFKPLTFSNFVYQASLPENKIDTKGKKVVILTDAHDRNTNL